LIQPPPGCGIAYIDWQQQEFGIAAALSGDPLMLAAYRSGDPYLKVARQSGRFPKVTLLCTRPSRNACKAPQ
jgi:DNA polymerase-1